MRNWMEQIKAALQLYSLQTLNEAYSSPRKLMYRSLEKKMGVNAAQWHSTSLLDRAD